MTNREEAKMTQEQPNPTNQDNNIEITKARSRVTANTPAFSQNPPTDKGKLLEYEFYLTKNGYSKATIKTRVKILRLMFRHNVDLDNPEAVSARALIEADTLRNNPKSSREAFASLCPRSAPCRCAKPHKKVSI